MSTTIATTHSTVMSFITSTSSATPGETIQVPTTFTSSSSICVATLQAQVLDNLRTAFLFNRSSTVGFITLGQTCLSTSVGNERVTTKTVYGQYSTSDVSRNVTASGISNGALAGIIVAAISGIAVILGVVGLLWWRRRRRASMRQATLSPKVFDSDSTDDEVSLRCEKDGMQIQEMSGDREIVEKAGTEIREMLGDQPAIEIGLADDWVPSPIENWEAVEIGDSRSIRSLKRPSDWPDIRAVRTDKT